MALNSDQLIERFVALRYPIRAGCCGIDKREMQARRKARSKQIRDNLKGLPEKDKREVVTQMIEKENALS